MIEIMTLTLNTAYDFDRAVNSALADGWDLVRRECFITGSDRATTFYAELERFVDEPVIEDPTADSVAVWVLSRDPHFPFKCSACGYKTHEPSVNCPNCNRLMEIEE